MKKLGRLRLLLQPCPRLVVIELKKPGVPARAAQPANVNAAVQAPESALFIRRHWFYSRDDL